jgi:hypothetical protein
MNEKSVSHLEQLTQIRSIMAQSSRFISLSGWSGIVAGMCALIGAFIANQKIELYYATDYGTDRGIPINLFYELLLIAAIVLIVASMLAFLFTYKKTKQEGFPIWNQISKRLLWNTLLPIVVGGIFILKLSAQNLYGFVAPACLVFYGLGLVNGSKYTLGEVRYLGYANIVLGIVNLFYVQQGLLCWALGFGVFHIVYGAIMWWKYERVGEN